MTCVVAMVDRWRNVWMGGDAAAVSDSDLCARRDPKVFHVTPFMIGFAESFRMGQLLRFRLPLTHLSEQSYAVVDGDDDGALRFMTTTFVDAVRDTLREGGMAKKQDGVESGGPVLVGWRGWIFEVDYQVGVPLNPFAAIGCGAPYALGALYALKTVSGQEPRQLVRIALEAAAEHSAGVRPPFTIESLAYEPNGTGGEE